MVSQNAFKGGWREEMRELARVLLDQRRKALADVEDTLSYRRQETYQASLIKMETSAKSVEKC